MAERKYTIGKRDEFMPLVEESTSQVGEILVHEERLLFTPTGDGSFQSVQLLAQKVDAGWRPFFPKATINTPQYVKRPTDGFLSNVLRGVLGYPSERHIQGAGIQTLTGFIQNLEEYAHINESEMDRVRGILNEISESLKT